MKQVFAVALITSYFSPFNLEKITCFLKEAYEISESGSAMLSNL